LYIALHWRSGGFLVVVFGLRVRLDLLGLDLLEFGLLGLVVLLLLLIGNRGLLRITVSIPYSR
jgi:hypothetical protein